MNTKTAQRDDWRTPPALFDYLNGTRKFGGPGLAYHFDTDAAADDSNHLLPQYWTAKDDALRQDWTGRRIFCNPPFSLKGSFAAKAALREAEIAAVILPATIDQGWFHKYVIESADVIHILRGRVKFLPPNGINNGSPRFSTVIAVWYKAPRPLNTPCFVTSLAI